MHKQKIAAVTMAVIISNFSANTVSVLAHELESNKVVQNISNESNQNKQSTKATVSKFDLPNSKYLEAYNKAFKVDNSKITSITNNGGNYGSSVISRAIDGNISTHWETGKGNSSDFENEITFTLDEVTSLNRIVYAARQDGHKGRGFASKFELYASLTDEGDDFELVSTGESNLVRDIVEIKFNSTEFKRIKFKFKETYGSSLATASEFMFYKEDEVSDKMSRLFTDSSMNTVSEEFNSVEMINILEGEVKNHPLYEDFKENIENAKKLVNRNEVNYADAKVSTFKAINDNVLPIYDDIYKIPLSKVKSITTNGGNYAENAIERAIDGEVATKWHSAKQNSSSFTNEVVIELDELTTLNRIVYTAPRGSNRGFAEQFDIYASSTSKGDTFELVSSGSSIATQNSVEIRFNPTEFKRVKFVFKKGYENWACAAEFGLYTKDEVKEKMERLFTDNTLSVVSEEFNTIEKISALEEEAKTHPFYEDYKEDLKNALEIIESGEVEEISAKVSKFTPFYTSHIDAYDKDFRVSNDKIQSITNNGGNYGGSSLKYATDEDENTHWETGKPNSGSFKNEINLTLAEAEVINRVTYKSRTSGKGFAKNFSIYISPTTKGDNFTKVTSGGYTVTSDLLEFKFNPTKVKRLKFVFDNAHDSWASIADFRLYKEDKVYDKMQRIFTNSLMNEVSTEFNTLEKLETLDNETKGHPLEEIFKEDIEKAREVLQGTLETTKVVVAEQHGNMSEHASKNLKFGFGNNNQATGVSAKPGEQITVYVDANPNEPLPTLMFSQQEGSFANWERTVSLHPGKNIITVPEIQKDNWYKHDVTKGGPIYIVNPYTPEQQSSAPVLRFVGGDKFPFLTKDTNVEEFKQELIEYKKRIDEDIKENPNVLDRKVIDTFEFVSDHIVWTGTASGAYEAYINQDVNPLDTVKSYNVHMKEIFRYYGLDARDEKHDPKFIRENVRLAQPYGYMYAATGHIGVQRDVMANHLIPFETRGPSWGLTHEIGHKMDVGPRVFGEVTNNMLPQHMSVFYNQVDKRIPFESHVYKNVMSETSNNYMNGEFFERLAVFWQLETMYPGYWGKVNSIYRERNISVANENEKMDMLARISSEALELDLTEHFARHGFYISNETKEFTSKYKKPDKKLWYVNFDSINYKGKGLSSDTTLDVNAIREGDKTKLTFKIGNNAKNDILGYEIIKDGNIVAFTSANSFVDNETNDQVNSRYEIVPYARNLEAGTSVSIDSHSPVINLQQKKIIVKLGEEFNPLKYAKANDYIGNDITNEIKIKSNVDVNAKGNYKVEYEVINRGVTIKEVLDVEVVSDYNYLSDKEWNSVEAQWGNPRRNTNIKGRSNGDIKTFDKGFGIHAKGKITYDLGEHDYDTLDMLVGVDMSIQSQNYSSVTFKVIGDGKTLATTNVLKHANNMVGINVPVKDVKQLVIEVHDGGNVNKLDHAVIVNPKLTTNNAKPVITAENRMYKLGSKVDLMDGVLANDIEDGDLTSKIEIVSNNYEENKAGRFEIVYKVSDNDNNIFEKKVYITVYEDFNVGKSKYGQFNNLNKYNEKFKIPVVSVSNNGGNYGSSVIGRVIDNNINTHWETNKPNSGSFKNEVIFDLGESKEISKIAYAARRDAGGKGFASKFEIYVSNESEGNDFILAGNGEYKENTTDVLEFDIAKTSARRVKFKFVEANQNWASLSEVSFYKEDALSDKIAKQLFTDSSKTNVTEAYNTLEKLEKLRAEVKNHPAISLFESDLNKAEELIRDKFPTLNVEETTFVKLNSEFDLMNGVSANDQEDGDITSKVTVSTNGLNMNKTGEYKVTYTVTDSDKNVATKERKIIVYSDEKYLSDMNWKSAVSGWREVNKDSAVSVTNKIKLNVDGEIKEFDKGLGAATNSEIVYDLDGRYTHFTTYLGTDKNFNDDRTSIIFKIFADGKEVYTSDLISKNSKSEFVELDITGVKELKLIANDAGNGGLGDFASWADTKIYSINSKPQLTIPKSVAIKLGEKIDLNEEYSALDAEDGDITSNVEVTGRVNFNKPGKYPITYKVVDSDGNEVIKTRTISIVNMEDYKYLTEYNWKSASQSYGSAKKDKATSGKSLRLTDADGKEVSYQRGIGAHSTSTVVYDLTNKDYAYFTSYIGVDRQMYGTVGSVSFEVYVDGEKKFDSGLMRANDTQKYVEVDINDAKELKLIVKDGGNGNGSDHATWGDTKLHFANENGQSIESEERKELRKLVEYADTLTKDMIGAKNHIDARWSNFEIGKQLAKESLEDDSQTDEEVKNSVNRLNYFIFELEIKEV